MAITARFIDGTSYDDPDIAEVYDSLHGTSFVTPSLGTDNLAVVSTGAGDASVTVGTGIAQVLGYFYENTADVTLALDAQGGGLNRIDRIVLRVSTANQTVRATVLKGTAAAAPDIPALAATDMGLAWVWVPDGFGAASTVASADVHDDRLFGASGYYHDTDTTENLLSNSEWMAWSTPAAAVAPDLWYDNIAAGTIAATTIQGNAPRGQGAQVTLANNEYFECSLPAPVENIEDNTLTPMTLWGNLLISAGGPLKIQVISEAGTNYHVNKSFYATTTYHDFVEHFTINYVTYSAITSIRVRYFNDSGGNVTFTCDPPILTKGFIAGPPRQKHEIIPLAAAITDANWNSTAKSTGTTQIDLDADFNAYVPSGVRALFGRLRCRDSGSAAAAAPLGLEALSYYPSTGSGGRVEIASAGNDDWCESGMIVGVDIGTNSFSLDADASGAGTLDAFVTITGIVT